MQLTGLINLIKYSGRGGDTHMKCNFAIGKSCKILTVKCVDPDRCSFQITSESFEASRLESNERLKALTPLVQSCIADKYYSGRKVWRDEDA